MLRAPAKRNADFTDYPDRADRQRVLGVRVGKDARAYPINMLTGPDREIINDTLGEKAIAATR
jgi:hypothetical protein